MPPGFRRHCLPTAQSGQGRRVRQQSAVWAHPAAVRRESRAPPPLGPGVSRLTVAAAGQPESGRSSP